MPFSFANRPPNPFFAQHRMRARGEDNERQKNDEAEKPAGLRYYPLDQGTPARRRHPGATPVNPLSARGGPTRPMAAQVPVQQQQGPRPNALGQTIQQPAQFQAQPQKQQSQDIPPERAVERFRRANHGLPDGVRYEPLDEQTMRMLRENGHLPEAPVPSPPPKAMLPATPQQTVPEISPVPSHAPIVDTATGFPSAVGSMGVPTAMPNFTPQQPVNPPIPSFVPPQPVSPPMPSFVPQQPVSPPVLNLAPPQSTSLVKPEAESSNSASEPPPSSPTSLSTEIGTILERMAQDERNALLFYSHIAPSAPRKDMADALTDIANDCEQRMHIYSSLLARHFKRNFTPEKAEINTRLNFDEGIALALSEENKSLRSLAELLEDLNDSEVAKIIQGVINKKVVNHNMLSLLGMFEPDAHIPFRL